MRLLTVTHFYETHGGGIERVAGQLNREFQRLGYDTVWAASGEDAPPPADVATPVSMRCFNAVERLTGVPMPLPAGRALSRLSRAVRESDGVIIHDALYATSLAAMLAARLAGKPVVLIQHIAGVPFANPLPRAAMRLANRLVTPRMLAAADQVVFISDTVRQTFARVTFRAPPRLAFNGVDTAVFHAAGDAREERLALFVGRFVEKKGLAHLERLARRRTDWRFVFAGSGPIDPARWGLPNVSVERGRSDSSLAELYRRASVLLLPSVGEGYPLVIQEAMACGLPVICGAESARADPDASAWLKSVDVDPGNADATARRLSAALDRPVIDAAERTAMAAYAARTYRWPVLAEVVLAGLTG